MRRNSAILLLVLLAGASIGGVFRVAAIERPGSPIGVPTVSPVFSPNGDGRRDSANVQLRVRARGKLTVDIVDRTGRTVRNLVPGAERRGDVRLRWDGRTEGGRRAREGVYEARMQLDDRRFAVRSPIRLDVTPPDVTSAVADLSRLRTKLRVVRLYLAATGVETRSLLLDGRPLEPVPYSLRRSRADRAAHRYAQVRQSFVVPEGTTAAALSGALTVIVTDLAGNRATAPVALPKASEAPFEPPFDVEDGRP